MSRRERDGLVLGGHGDTMVPLPRYSTVAGVPVTELIAPGATRADWCSARATAAPRSWTCSRPAAPSMRPRPPPCEMVDAILKDKKKILPCAAYLEGEYGINGLFVGVPVKLGAAASKRSSRSS